MPADGRAVGRTAGSLGPMVSEMSLVKCAGIVLTLTTLGSSVQFMDPVFGLRWTKP